MEREQKYLTISQALIFLAFVLGALVRFIGLGRLPLTDVEAQNALQAFWISAGTSFSGGSQPAYTSLTAFLFFFNLTSDYFARFWPALAGSLLIFVPWLFRKLLTNRVAVPMAFILAFEPGLVALSRQADGTMLAVAGLLLGLGFWMNGNLELAGIGLAFAFLGGPEFWPGMLVLMLAAWAAGLLKKDSTPFAGNELKRMAVGFGPATLLLGTVFFTHYTTLAGIGNAFLAYFRGWGAAFTLSPLTLMNALVSYQLVGLVFAVIATIVIIRRGVSWEKFIAFWWLLSLILALVYPARAVTSLGWSIIPMWTLAVRQFVSLLQWRKEDQKSVIGFTVLFCALTVLAFLSILGMLVKIPGSADAQFAFVGLIAAVGLLVAAFLLVSWGWSYSISGQGFLYGLAIVTAVFGLAFTLRTAGWSSNPASELWRSGDYVQDAHLVVQTADQFSLWNTGEKNSLDMVVVGKLPASMQWYLRNYKDLQEVQGLTAQSTPAMLITWGEETPVLTSGYRGVSFVWYTRPTQTAADSNSWIKWWLIRNQALDKTQGILWVRVDLFAGHEDSINQVILPSQPLK